MQNLFCIPKSLQFVQFDLSNDLPGGVQAVKGHFLGVVGEGVLSVTADSDDPAQAAGFPQRISTYQNHFPGFRKVAGFQPVEINPRGNLNITAIGSVPLRLVFSGRQKTA